MEEHEALFITAVLSAMKMTIGSKFQASLPKRSVPRLLTLVSTSASRSILLW